MQDINVTITQFSINAAIRTTAINVAMLQQGPPGSNDADIAFVIDGGGSVIQPGIMGDLEIPFACTIKRATLLADKVGSMVIDIWKDTYANFPPVAGDSITGSSPPTLSSQVSAQDAVLSGWNVNISAGDVLRFNVNSASNITRVTLSLKIIKA